MKLKVQIINLEHRLDRRDDILQNVTSMSDLQVASEDILKAYSTPANGMLGCAMSHFSAISNFVLSTDYDFLLVFEDDFNFKNKTKVCEILNSLQKNVPLWDVFLLSYNKGVFTEAYPSGFNRIINSQTASGYILKRSFAPKLLNLFGMSINYMAKYLGKGDKGFTNSLFAHDQMWKALQLDYFFISTNPSLGFQKASFSDIENVDVNYGV